MLKGYLAEPPSLPAPAPQPSAWALSLPHGAVVERTSDDSVDWRRGWAALVRFRWLIAAVVFAGTLFGVALTRVVQPAYVTQATVWIDESGRPGAEQGPMRPAQLLAPQAWMDLLRSYAVLESVARSERLYLDVDNPARDGAFAGFGVGERYRPGSYRLTVGPGRTSYALTTEAGTVLERGVPGDSIGRTEGFRWSPGPDQLPANGAIAFRLTTLRDAARRLDASLDARVDLSGSFLEASLKGSNPAQLARSLNALIQRYVAVAADLKRERLAQATAALTDQAQQAHRQLDAAETALEQFDARTITLPSASSGRSDSSGASPGAIGESPQVASFLALVAERDSLRVDREALQRSLGSGNDSGQVVDGLSPIGAVHGSPELASALQELTTKRAELRTLEYKYTDAYPPVARLRRDIATLERHTIPTLARQLIAVLARRERDLNRQVTSEARPLRNIPVRAIAEARLRRTARLAEALYTTLQARYDAARVEAASTFPDLSVLDSAVAPARPERDTASRLLTLAVCASLGLAIAAAVLLDRLDPRVRYPEQVSVDMGLPILGAVPHLHGDAARGAVGPGGEPRDDVMGALEGLRAVCLNLVHAHGGVVPFGVTITSLDPGDGKSFITANLARAFAAAGRRTVLVDGDARRGRLDRLLRVSRRPGLIDYLRGEVPLAAILRATGQPLLTLVPCGARAANAPELFGGHGMTDFMKELLAQFDVVLVDSPPLTAAVDPLILAGLTGDVALVLRTGRSRRDAAAARLEVFQRLSVRLLGVILNDVPADASYAYEAYRYYLPGYAARDEARVDPPRWSDASVG